MDSFTHYQIESRKTAVYPKLKANLVYPALGLAGEAGELADKIKKYWRNSGKFPSQKTLSDAQIETLLMELGDVLWYVATLATELGVSLENVASYNLEKLKDRKERDVIKSEGDNR